MDVPQSADWNTESTLNSFSAALLRVVIMRKQEIFGANFNTRLAHRYRSAGSLGRDDYFAAAEFSPFLFACVYVCILIGY